MSLLSFLRFPMTASTSFPLDLEPFPPLDHVNTGFRSDGRPRPWLAS